MVIAHNNRQSACWVKTTSTQSTRKIQQVTTTSIIMSVDRNTIVCDSSPSFCQENNSELEHSYDVSPYCYNQLQLLAACPRPPTGTQRKQERERERESHVAGYTLALDMTARNLQNNAKKGKAEDVRCLYKKGELIAKKR